MGDQEWLLELTYNKNKLYFIFLMYIININIQQ